MGDKEGVCCICFTGETTCVKPLYLTGAKPCFKTSASGWCCAKRCAVPCYGTDKDHDIEPTFGCAGLKCCECCPKCAPALACCGPVAPLAPSPSDAAFAAAPVQISDLYLLVHCCCVQCSSYVPATPQDAFGCDNQSICMCCQSNLNGLKLPADGTGYELCLLTSGQVKCLKPRCLCTGATRCFFNYAKIQFPPSKEVPCAIVCCGTKVAGPASIQKGGGDGFSFPKMPPPESQAIERPPP